MNNGTKLANVEDIPDNKTIVVSVDKRELLLTRIDGEIYAVENNCTHENLSMGECPIHNGEIQCPRHGARFDFKTGKATGLPAIMPIKTFEVEVDNDQVFIKL